MIRDRRRVLLMQLPIPPPGPEPIKGNVPLAAGYMKMYARGLGLEDDYAIDIFPAAEANVCGDRALVERILAREPWLVGFSCYLWNIERSLWIAERLKERRPDLKIMLGGPEITSDNAWVLEHPAVDFAALGEGEQTFAEMLTALKTLAVPPPGIAGLHVRGRMLTPPPFRKPLPQLDVVSSPYLAGILDVADEEMMLLETIRGCIFKCKFCFYPKSYDALYFLSQEKLIANLRHAREKGAKEIVLLDPTLNQRKDFPGFVRLLAEHNRERQFTYFGELRAEGINPEIAALLAEANFTEVEIGLQSVDKQAQALMDRRNNMKAFDKGIRALLDAGIHVKVDLIIGLPGDTETTVRDGMDYLLETGLYSSVQVFNLAVLPGTAFRQEAVELGLQHQDRPPYYVWKSPALDTVAMYDLMVEAQDRFGIEFDPLPPPSLRFPEHAGLISCARFDLDADPTPVLPPATLRTQAFRLHLVARRWDRTGESIVPLVKAILADNPFTTLEVVLEPADPRAIEPDLLERLMRACFERPTYLDKFYAVLPNPGRPLGAKRLVLIFPASERGRLDPDRLSELGDFAVILWRGPVPPAGETEDHEYFEAVPAAAAD